MAAILVEFCNSMQWTVSLDFYLLVIFFVLKVRRFFEYRKNIKVLVAGCHSFCLFFIFYNIHTFIQSHSCNTIHLSVAIRRGLSPFLHRLEAQWEKPPCGAEPRIELGPALQQADALPTKPRHTINRLSHAAPSTISTPHHTKPRRTITKPRRTILSHAAPY